jgi:hypothetical protein
VPTKTGVHSPPAHPPAFAEFACVLHHAPSTISDKHRRATPASCLFLSAAVDGTPLPITTGARWRWAAGDRLAVWTLDMASQSGTPIAMLTHPPRGCDHAYREAAAPRRVCNTRNNHLGFLPCDSYTGNLGFRHLHGSISKIDLQSANRQPIPHVSRMCTVGAVFACTSAVCALA